MAREIPEAVRAAAGLAATVLDEARKLPETLPGLPVRVLGLAMQASMKVQQQYACLVARGDELFTGIRGEDEPGLATFDEDEAQAPVAGAKPPSAFDRAAETTIEVSDEDGDAGGRAEEVDEGLLDELAIEELVDQTPPAESAESMANELLESDRDADGLREADVLAASPAGGAAQLADVPTGDGGVATVPATVTDEGVATPEPAAAPARGRKPARTNVAGDAEASARAARGARIVVGAGEIAVDDALGSGGPGNGNGAPAAAGEVANSLAEPATAPVDGYDDWSIAQLRGRLRGYAPATVQQLLDYEQATQAREPYLRMLRNRLERLAADTA